MSLKKKLKILIIDDEPITCIGLKAVLSEFDTKRYELFVSIAGNFQSAMEKLKEPNHFDIIFLDIILKPSNTKKKLSGIDLGLKIIKAFPKSRLVVFTGLKDTFRIREILYALNPDGLIIKNDIKNNEFLRALKKIMLAPPFYSSFVSFIKSLFKFCSTEFKQALTYPKAFSWF